MNKNVLIFGGGSKFGLVLSKQLSGYGQNIFNVTSRPSGLFTEIPVDWYTCDFMSLERLLKGLPAINIVIFNQNFCQIPELIDLQQPKPLCWKLGKNWMQSHFVNSILPWQVLTSLKQDGRFSHESLAVWMLSGVILKDDDRLLGYRSQKRLNKDIVLSTSKNNSGKFIGFDPGSLSEDNQIKKSTTLANFLLSGNIQTLFYQFNQDFTKVIPHTKFGIIDQ